MKYFTVLQICLQPISPVPPSLLLRRRTSVVCTARLREVTTSDRTRSASSPKTDTGDLRCDSSVFRDKRLISVHTDLVTPREQSSNARDCVFMARGKKGWTPEECEKLRALVRAGASPYRASVALARSVFPVKNKARELGCPFAHVRDVKNRTRAILAK